MVYTRSPQFHRDFPLKAVPFVSNTFSFPIKQTMQRDVRRCKTSEMVRKEIWGHLLVSNVLLRAAGVQAAS